MYSTRSGITSLLVSFIVLSCSAQRSYISDAWSMLSSDRPQANKCIDIPKSLSLCYGIQYTTMRLPNLLDHETIDEVIEQSTAWQSLVQLHCNPNTQLFLCSLFAPVCLPKVEKPIKPCRSLCEEVQNNCEDRMRSYGFPWPEMLRCDKFEDNDMCIKPFAAHTTSSEYRVLTGTQMTTITPGVNHACKSCAQASTFENILDNFCRVTTVVRARLRPHNDTHVLVKKAKTFKGTANDRKRLMQDRLMRISDLPDTTCTCPIAKGNFLIMANDTDKGELVAKLIMHWKHDTAFKNAIRKFRTVNCNTLGREIRESVLRQTYKRTAYN